MKPVIELFTLAVLLTLNVRSSTAHAQSVPQGDTAVIRANATNIAGDLVVGASGPLALPADFDALVRDRMAIERVYYDHRLGTRPPFEQVMPRALAERLVRQDLQKEAALRKVYRVELSPAQINAEVQRINSTTRAPDVLAELKAALGNDADRFARTVAKPILVERLLRDRFDNDDALHAPQRRECERVRASLLSARTNGAGPAQLLVRLKQSHPNDVTEASWQLGERPAGANAPAVDEIELKKRFGPNAQLLSSPRGAGAEQKFYFDDLPPELQKVLRAQLRQPGDVSAVIEVPGGFLLYLAEERTAERLRVAVLTLPKQNYEQWVSQQNESQP